MCNCFHEAIMHNTEHIKVLKIFLEVTACALLGLQNSNLLYTKKNIANVASHTQLLKFILLHLNILHFIVMLWHQILHAINQKLTYAVSSFLLLYLCYSLACAWLLLSTIYGCKDFSKIPVMLSSFL